MNEKQQQRRNWATFAYLAVTAKAYQALNAGDASAKALLDKKDEQLGRILDKLERRIQCGTK